MPPNPPAAIYPLSFDQQSIPYLTNVLICKPTHIFNITFHTPVL